MGIATIRLGQQSSTCDIYTEKFCYLGEGVRLMNYPFADPSEMKEKAKGQSNKGTTNSIGKAP